MDLHIPNIVEREFLTGCEIELIDDINKSYLKSIERKGLDSENIKLGKKINKLIDDLKSNINISIKKNWDHFIENFNVKLYEFDKIHGVQIMDSYFNGMPPFEKRKSRKDIPDAFIYEQIKDISQDFNNVIFISNDTNLRKKVEKNIEIEVYKSLEKFIKSNKIQNHLDFIKMTEQAKKLIHNMHKFEDYYEEEVLLKLEDMSYKLTFNDEYIPHDNNNYATISGFYEMNELELDYSNAIGLQSDIYIPFKVKVFAEIFYSIFKPDIWKVDERESIISISNLNDQFFEVYESVELIIKGDLSITISENKDVQFIKESDQKLYIDNIKEIYIQK